MEAAHRGFYDLPGGWWVRGGWRVARIPCFSGREKSRWWENVVGRGSFPSVIDGVDVARSAVANTTLGCAVSGVYLTNHFDGLGVFLA
jgi:hypothetical protein